MKIANPSMNLPATGRAFRPLSSGFQGALLILVLLTAVSSASAAITFDNATASKAKNNTSEISWKHTIGGGADAAVLVAISFNDFLIKNNQITAVSLGGVRMRPVPGS